MATNVVMPKLGLLMTEGTVVKWLKQDGGQVEKGEPLVVVMTKKITYELQAPASGIARIVAQPKETRLVGQVIGVILAPGEPMPDIEEAAAPPVAAVVVPEGEKPAPSSVPVAPPEAAREVRAVPAARRLARELAVDIARVPGKGPGGRITEEDVRSYYEDQSRISVTPLARRMAEAEGLDLAQITGTGVGGRIREDDVLRALQGPEGLAAVLPQVVPFTDIRQVIAERMMESLHSMAQFSLTSQADVSALVGLREVLRRRWDAPISYTDLLVKATALALREHPILNSTLVSEEIVLQSEINIGVAVALEDGLIVPVLREADKKSVLEIRRELEDMAKRAGENALCVDEVTGGTFTITNLGMYGVDAFTPIVNPPEVAILGVGRVTEQLALVNGVVAPRSKMVLSLTIDHRVVDGAPGAAFLQTLVRFLEHPVLIFAERGT